MIEGPVGDMVERNHARQDFKVPRYFADARPLALETGGSVLALICSDPRLDPRKMLDLDGTSGQYTGLLSSTAYTEDIRSSRSSRAEPWR